MVELLVAAGISFIVTVLAGLALIPFLRRLKFGQTILEIGPAWHMSKQGTPTMGGLMFMTGVTAAVLFAGYGLVREGVYAHLYVLMLAWLFGAIGFIDDYCKVKRKQNEGLTATQKLALQAAVGVAFLALMRYIGYLTPDLYIPFFAASWRMDWVVFLIFSIFLVVGMVNAVNLTDGVDGLCAGITLPVAVFFAAAALAWSKPELSLTAAALGGGMAGFLVYNFHPAKVFMGDTGSLFIGGLICGLAFALDAPVLMIVTGAVYILEMFSVILQVGYFKLTRGKRLFKMSPLHHHFEKSGWPEVKIFAVFTLATALICAATYCFGLK
ncbi:MAG: phospho-N-acetylmuramoyl-pentapeptide-transferase [Oscillospiraceae bacterium]|nr:phospho-N-acetylmuramoyl-pentapeptide-transferase [Oscillospiraceae bacterium]